MKLVTCVQNGETFVARVSGDSVQMLVRQNAPVPAMLDVIAGGPARWLALAQMQPISSAPLAAVELLAPIPRPAKNIMCLGKNYLEHAREVHAAQGKELQIPAHTAVFTKAPTTANGPHAPIPFDAAVSSQLDWEVELAVVIGIGGKNIAREAALRHVFGYMVLNDVSARDIQYRHQQFFMGKSLDGSCPMGPWIVTSDELPDAHNLRLRCWVNGVLKQDSNTAQLMLDVAGAIAVLSHGRTLEPGDIIATGTPEGVGFARQPPEFLAAGDVVECEVERIGRLRNTVVAVGA